MLNEVFERVLIIGGTGFIGSNLVSELVNLGCIPTVLTRNKLYARSFKNSCEKTNYVELDITDLGSTKRFIKKFRPTLIINSAATLGLVDSNGKIAFEVNNKAIKNILQISLETAVHRIILFGSADEYGYQPVPQNENFPLAPNSPYAISKAELTKLALEMHQSERLPVVILRPFTVYGRAQPKGMFLSDAIRCALNNRTFEMTEGLQKRDYLFISDFVRAILNTIRTPEIEGEVFNIGSGQFFALKEIAGKVWEICGADKSLLKIGARKASISELHDTCADISKASRILNWKPTISLDKGLEETIKSIKENL